MTSNTTYRTHPEDLSAQKVNLSVPQKRRHHTSGTTIIYGRANIPSNEFEMDPGIAAAIVIIAVWAVVTFTTDAPGYVHLLVTVGFFLLFWRIVARDGGRSGPGSGS